MNFLKAAVAIVDGKACVALGNSAQQLPMPADQAYYQTLTGRAVTFGIRPEDITWQHTPQSVQVDAQVELIEDLGADLLIHSRVGHLKLVARADRETGITTGMATRLFFPVHKLHLFIDHRRVDLPRHPR